MDHNRAVESQAVERYLLGEMTPEERDVFEEHFFACEDCANEVRAGARFRANSRQILPEFPGHKAEAREKRFWNWWRPPALAWATAALAVVVVYQAAIQMPSLRRQLGAQAVPALALHANTRGESLPRVSASTGLFLVYFDLPGPAAASYQCVLTDASGKVVDNFPAASHPNEPLNVLLDRSRLAPGRYTLTLKKSMPETGTLPSQFLFIVE
jgi:predicted anti-sigma-YlaC factor YlaD